VQASVDVRPDFPAPVAVVLHGSGGDAEQGLRLLEPSASEAGWIVLAPASAARGTWSSTGWAETSRKSTRACAGYSSATPSTRRASASPASRTARRMH